MRSSPGGRRERWVAVDGGGGKKTEVEGRTRKGEERKGENVDVIMGEAVVSVSGESDNRGMIAAVILVVVVVA